jgi:hypothetical protein
MYDLKRIDEGMDARNTGPQPVDASRVFEQRIKKLRRERSRRK